MTPHPEDLIVTRWHAQFQGRRIACAIGKAGIGVKTGEGDNITPRGVHRLVWVAYRPDRTPCPRHASKARPIGPFVRWSDDPLDPRYNQPVRAFRYTYSRENLRRADPLYDMIGVLDFNYPTAKPGHGSAIFLHVWRQPRFPTSGCVAFHPQDLRWIFEHWTPRSRVIIR